jgi:F-type H+-transporting ATPase subunit alpha
MVEALKQKQHRPYRLWEEVVVLWAASKGHLDAVPREQVQERLEGLLGAVEFGHKDLVAAIEKKRELTDDVAAGLEKAVVGAFAKETA